MTTGKYFACLDRKQVKQKYTRTVLLNSVSHLTIYKFKYKNDTLFGRNQFPPSRPWFPR